MAKIIQEREPEELAKKEVEKEQQEEQKGQSILSTYYSRMLGGMTYYKQTLMENIEELKKEVDALAEFNKVKFVETCKQEKLVARKIKKGKKK